MQGAGAGCTAVRRRADAEMNLLQNIAQKNFRSLKKYTAVVQVMVELTE
jgi:hypothetical protein